MKQTLFLDRLIDIQKDYAVLLEKGLAEWNEEYFSEFIEEVNIFWKKNEPVLANIYEYEFPKINTVFLTAVTKVDVEDFQHYSMKTTKALCLIDDPLIFYLNIINRNLPSKMREELSKAIRENIIDSINLIKVCKYDYIILPLRTLVPREILTSASEQFFISLFSNINDIDEYFKKIQSFNDIEKKLNPMAKKVILFGWDDLGNGTLEERFNEFIKNEYMGNKDAKVSEIFFFSQIGYISQAMNILMVMTTLHFVPYIRGYVPYKYFMLLYSSLKQSMSLDLDRLVIRTTISYFFERLFDYETVLNVSYADYLEIVENIDVYAYVENDLSLINKNLEEVSLQQIETSVEHFYTYEFINKFK